MWAILPVVLGIMVFAVTAIAGTASKQKLPNEFSWYGKSGAKNAPVYDREKGGYWWMPDRIPSGKENTQWGNRGYVFVGTTGEKPEAKVMPVKAVSLRDVYFACDSANLTPGSLQILKENAEIIKMKGAKVMLVGSASPEGDSGYNQKLSERRAKAVKDYLVSKQGVAAESLIVEAKGAIPVANKASWPSVRKVQFIIKK